MKILFLDSAHPFLKEALKEKGYTCDEDFISSKEEVEKKISSYTGIVFRSRFTIDREFITRASNLKFIARVGAGMEHIDVASAESKGIRCLSSPEGNKNAVAEHTLGMLLSMLNNICKANNEVREGKWFREANRGVELDGKTIGIYGYGNTGSALVKLLSSFDVRILVYDKYKRNFEVSASLDLGRKIYEITPEEIFAQADILTLHLPLTNETHYLVDDSFLNKFKKNIYLINTSRGPIVKTDDLALNLKSGKVQGACLDVLEYEESSFEFLSPASTDRSAGAPLESPESLQYLLNSNKVVLTPHIAGWSIESSKKMAKILSEKIIALIPHISISR